jgi:hypothetical protein
MMRVWAKRVGRRWFGGASAARPPARGMRRAQPGVEALELRDVPSVSPLAPVMPANAVARTVAVVPANARYQLTALFNKQWISPIGDSTYQQALIDYQYLVSLYGAANVRMYDSWTGQWINPYGSSGGGQTGGSGQVNQTFQGIVLEYRQGNVWRVYRGQVLNYSSLAHTYVGGSAAADMSTYYRWGNEVIALERQWGVQITSGNISQYLRAHYETFSTASFHVVNGVVYAR